MNQLVVTPLLLAINATIFLWMAWESGQFWMPSDQVLLSFGVKNANAILHGEGWRLFTAMFVHIGFLHFLLNSLALRVVGRQLEPILGPTRMLAIYLLGGLFGNILSMMFIAADSAGASGAIFAWFGIGLAMEHDYAKRYDEQYGQKLKRGPYAKLVWINVILGLMLSAGPIRLDNGAHLGGLATGYFLGRFWSTRSQGREIFAFVFVCMLLPPLAWLSLQPSTIMYRYQMYAKWWTSPQSQFELLSETIRIIPEAEQLRFDRGILLLRHHQYAEGEKDLAMLGESWKEQARLVMIEFQNQRLFDQALFLKRIFHL